VFHGSGIGHDTELGDFSHVYSLVSIGGGVRVGEGSSVFPGAKVVPRVSIGAGATVGIGSTVVRDVGPGVTVFGSPAERFRIA
jgi:acetyltransferase-like isoleucine patch superfamily enzyme